ncbi:hypothetical protein ACTMTI_44300 [Nonomuraea sp. H19]|uniref:hypothetical protein n=1 Tax=Nonomuraea sp. H19 TaxID=3452206 RepID=UPI003F8AE6B2
MGDLDWRRKPMLSPLGGFLTQRRAGENGNYEVVITWPDGGLAHYWRDNSSVLAHIGPVLASGGRLFVAWKGSGESDDVDLNLITPLLFANSAGGFGIEGIESKVTLEETSEAPPALAFHNGRLFLAWKGDGNDNLNLMFSDDNGATFKGKITFEEFSDRAPTLASHAGRLFLGWRGLDKQLNVAKVTLFANSAGGFGIEGIEGKITLDETSDMAPALASHSGRLFLAWAGKGNRQLNLSFSGDNGATFQGKRTFDEFTPMYPALASHGGRLFMAWRGSGNENLSVAKVTLFANTAGGFGIEGIEGKVTLDEKSRWAPSMASHRNMLFLAWIGVGDSPNINLIFSDDNGTSFKGKKTFDHAFVWHGPIRFGQGDYIGSTLIESDFRFIADSPLGNLEVLASRPNGTVDHYWMDNSRRPVWNGPFKRFDNVIGNPSMAYTGAVLKEGLLGSRATHEPFDFVIVTPHGSPIAPRQAAGFSIHDGGSAQRWSTRMVGEELETIGSVRLVGVGLALTTMYPHVSATGYADMQSYGSVVVAGVSFLGWIHLHQQGPLGHLVGLDWRRRTTLGHDLFPELDGEFTGIPCIIQGDYGYEEIPEFGFMEFGHFGNLELVVPSIRGGIVHFFKDCGELNSSKDVDEGGWSGPIRIPGPQYDEVSLIQSTFADGDHGNLEMIARQRDQRGFDFYWRDGASVWHGPASVGDGPSSRPAVDPQTRLAGVGDELMDLLGGHRARLDVAMAWSLARKGVRLYEELAGLRPAGSTAPVDYDNLAAFTPNDFWARPGNSLASALMELSKSHRDRDAMRSAAAAAVARVRVYERLAQLEPVVHKPTFGFALVNDLLGHFGGGLRPAAALAFAQQGVHLYEELAGLRPTGSTAPVDYDNLAAFTPNEHWGRPGNSHLATALMELATSHRDLDDMATAAVVAIRRVRVYERLAQLEPTTYQASLSQAKADAAAFGASI